MRATLTTFSINTKHTGHNTNNNHTNLQSHGKARPNDLPYTTWSNI